MEALTSIEKREGFVKVEDLSYYIEFNSSPDMSLSADLLNVTAINIRRKYVNQ
jgi:GTP:adenosylcobinamide-phosphate guanylyltransferase